MPQESVETTEPASEVLDARETEHQQSADVGHVDRPLLVSSGLAVLAGVLTILLVANAAGQVVALGITLGGAAVLAVGFEVRSRDHRLLGLVLVAGGIVGVAAGVGWAVIGTATVNDRIVVIPGLLGLAALAGGLGSAVRGYERWFVSAGASGLLLTVIVSGMVQDSPPMLAMLAAAAATYVAWDCGEQAINMGRQVGRQARTWRTELVHGGVSSLVGGVGVVAAFGFVTLGVGGVPLLALAAILLAAVILGAAMYL